MVVKLDARSILAGALNEALGLERRCCFCARVFQAASICPASGFFHDMDGMGEAAWEDLTGTLHEGTAAHIQWTLAPWEMFHAGAIDEPLAGQLLSRVLDWHLGQPDIMGRRFLREAHAYSAARDYRPLSHGRLAAALPVLWGNGRLLLDASEAPMVAALLGEAWQDQHERHRPRLAEEDRHWIHQWSPEGRELTILPALRAFDSSIDARWSAAVRGTMELVLGRLNRLRKAVATGDRSLVAPTPAEAALPKAARSDFHVSGMLGLLCEEGESGRAGAFRYLMEEGGWTLPELDAFLRNCRPDGFQWVRAVARARRIGLPARRPGRGRFPEGVAASAHLREAGPFLLSCESALLAPLAGALPPGEALAALLASWPWELDGSRMPPRMRLFEAALEKCLRRSPGDREAVCRVLAEWVAPGPAGAKGWLGLWHGRLQKAISRECP